MRNIQACLLVLGLWSFTGCAMITGTTTGAFTGLVDAPAVIYRQNESAFHDFPLLYGLDAIVFAPIGFVTGPVLGFAKGLSLDLQWITREVSYRSVFGSYGEESVWRPWTLRWPTKRVTQTTNSQ